MLHLSYFVVFLFSVDKYANPSRPINTISEQQIVDCYLPDCDTGGSTQNVIKWVHDRSKRCLLNPYKYKNSKGSCLQRSEEICKDVGIKMHGEVGETEKSFKGIIEGLAQRPLVVSIRKPKGACWTVCKET